MDLTIIPQISHNTLFPPSMEPQPSSTVDTSRPFSSVKEAVAIFGERLLLGEVYSPKPFSPSPVIIIKRDASSPTPSPSPSPSPTPPSPAILKERENGNLNAHLLDTIKKLERELEETKVELKLLKERGSDTEVALATLNAQLHKNMSKLAQAEAAAAGKAATAAKKTVRFDMGREKVGEIEEEVEEKRKEQQVRRRMEESPSLAHIMSLGENDHLFGGKTLRKKKKMKNVTKQKPIIPLVGDFLSFRRKTSSPTNHHNNPLYASPY